MGVLARTRPLWPVAILALPLVVSCLLLQVPLLCDGPLNPPGNLQLLAVAFALGIAARSYNLLFGYIGVLSFGHALFFGSRVHLPTIAPRKWGWARGAAGVRRGCTIDGARPAAGRGPGPIALLRPHLSGWLTSPPLLRGEGCCPQAAG